MELVDVSFAAYEDHGDFSAGGTQMRESDEQFHGEDEGEDEW